MAVTLSLVVGGESSLNRSFVRAVQSLGAKAIQQSAELAANDVDLGLAIGLDVVFKVSGPIDFADFEGVEPGKWIAAKRLMVMQVGVSERMSGVADNLFLCETLRAVVEGARDYLERRRIPVSLERVEQIVGELVASLEESAP